jgi:hypothetical protein
MTMTKLSRCILAFTVLTSPAAFAGGGDAVATLSNAFRFAIVGDTRPTKPDDVAKYPTAIITAIWDDIEHSSPHPDFAISTGDYQFSSINSSGTVNKQFDLYLGARGRFSGTVYPAMGNHECAGATASNCGQGNRDGITSIYSAFMTRMLNPQGITKPYYEVKIAAQNGSWTAKIVIVAANAWDSAQATWLDQALAESTTYTFIVRHESASVTNAPGVTPSEVIINKHPFTLKIVGHKHKYEHKPTLKEVVCGNGGAPLALHGNHGFAIVERLANGILQFTEYDYQTKAIVDQFRISADGSAAL